MNWLTRLAFTLLILTGIPVWAEDWTPLVEALADRSNGSLETFRQLRDKAEPAIPLLIKKLDEKPPSNRSACPTQYADALALIGSKALPALKQALRSQSERVRFQAARALESMDKPGTEALPELLDCVAENSDVSWAACRALLKIDSPDPSQIPRLIAILNREDAFDACRMLSQIGKAAVLPLIDAIKIDPAKQEKGAYALQFIGSDAEAAVPLLVELLIEGLPDRGKAADEAAGALGAIGSAAALPVARLLSRPDTPLVLGQDRQLIAWPLYRHIQRIFELLGRDGVSAIDVLAQFLDNESASRREVALNCLTHINVLTPPILDKIKSLSTDPDDKVRATALECLIKLGPKSGALSEMRQGLHDECAECRKSALAGLVTMSEGREPPMNDVIAALADPDADVQDMAMYQIQRIGPPAAAKAAPTLIRFLKDARPAAKKESNVIVVGGTQSQTPRALDALIATRCCDSKIIKQLIALAIKNEWYADEEWSSSLCWYFCRIGEKEAFTVPAQLVEILNSTSPTQGRYRDFKYMRPHTAREWALTEIALAGKQAAPALEHILGHVMDLPFERGGEHQGWFGERFLTLIALRNMGRLAVPGLLELYQEQPSARDFILDVLCEMDGTEAEEAVDLISESLSGEFHSAYNAVFALAKMGPAAKRAEDRLLKTTGRIDQINYGGYGAPDNFVNDYRIASQACVSLYAITGDSERSAGILRELLLTGATGNSDVMYSLGQCGPAALPIILEFLKHETLRVEAVYMLSFMEELPATVLPAVLELFKPDKIQASITDLSRLVENMGREAAPALPVLLRLLRDNSLKTDWKNILKAIQAIGPTDSEIVVSTLWDCYGREQTDNPLILKLLHSNGADLAKAAPRYVPTLVDQLDRLSRKIGFDNQEQTLPILDEIIEWGPSAKASKPFLRRLKNNGTTLFRDKLKGALEAIEQTK